VRYRFKGTVRTTGRVVEGHAHGETPDEALQALSEHGIAAESLREEPESAATGTAATPLHSALESALDTASQQVDFDKLANKYKGKSVWVLDRDKIRSRVAQVVDSALKDAMSDSKVGMTGMNDVREQVAQAISGLFKDNRNLTSQVSSTSNQLEGQVRRIESMVKRAESVLAQMTLAISKMGSMNYSGGGGVGPRRFAGGSASQGSEQNAVLVEIFKENLRLRGIEIDESPASEVPTEEASAGSTEVASATWTEAATETETRPERPEHPEISVTVSPEIVAQSRGRDEDLPVPQPATAEQTPLKQWTNNL
jgi:hypothetical protein